MRGLMLGTIGLIGAAVWAQAAPVVPRTPVAPLVQRIWAPACLDLEPGRIVRSARPLKEGSGTDRRRFWRGHWQVTQVLHGGRFLADPLYRKDDTTGEIRRGDFSAFPGETARTPPGALMCEAFVSE